MMCSVWLQKTLKKVIYYIDRHLVIIITKSLNKILTIGVSTVCCELYFCKKANDKVLTESFKPNQLFKFIQGINIQDLPALYFSCLNWDEQIC